MASIIENIFPIIQYKLGKTTPLNYKGEELIHDFTTESILNVGQYLDNNGYFKEDKAKRLLVNKKRYFIKVTHQNSDSKNNDNQKFIVVFIPETDILPNISELIDFDSLRHELKNPLNIIMSANELLKQHTKDIDNSSIKKLTSIIDEETNRITRTLNNTRFLSEMSIKLEQENIHHILNTIMQNISTLFDNQNKIHISIDNNITTLNVDKDKIHIMLFNIIKNACEVKEQNIIDITITNAPITYSHHQNYIKIDIKNDSPIPQNIKNNLFKPFYSTKKNGQGLGLTIATQIAKLHNGWIELTTNNESTTFSVIIAKNL